MSARETYNATATSEQRRENAQRGWQRASALQTPRAKGTTCPECGITRHNSETLHAHRVIAHGVSV